MDFSQILILFLISNTMILVVLLIFLWLVRRLIGMTFSTQEEMFQLMSDTKKLQENINELMIEIAVLKASVQKTTIDTSLTPKR